MTNNGYQAPGGEGGKKPKMAIEPVYKIDFTGSSVTISAHSDVNTSVKTGAVALAGGLGFGIALWFLMTHILNIETNGEMGRTVFLASLAASFFTAIASILARRKTIENISLTVITSQKEIEMERLRYSAADLDPRIADLMRNCNEPFGGEVGRGITVPVRETNYADQSERANNRGSGKTRG